MHRRECRWPAFGIYGHDVKDAADREIPADVREKILLKAGDENDRKF